MKNILLLIVFLLAAINYQAEAVKKFPQSSCVKLGKTHADMPDQFFISKAPEKNPKWLSREQPSCALAWQEAYIRNVR